MATSPDSAVSDVAAYHVVSSARMLSCIHTVVHHTTRALITALSTAITALIVQLTYILRFCVFLKKKKLYPTVKQQ